MKIKMAAALVAGLCLGTVVVLLLPGCGANHRLDRMAGQGRFLFEMLRGNEEARVGGEWVDPAKCRDSTDYIVQMSRKRGMVATELPVWVADWAVVANPSGDEAVPLLISRECPEFGREKVVVVRRGGQVQVIPAAELRSELQRRFGTTDRVLVGGRKF